MPFAGHEDFGACVEAHSDKEDPEAYCASIRRDVEGKALPDTAFTADEMNALAVTQKEWRGPETGPRGGTFWVNTETGEKVYDDPTGEDDGGSSNSSNDDGLSVEEASRDALLGAMREVFSAPKFKFFEEETETADEIRDLLDQLPDEEYEEVEDSLETGQNYELAIESSRHVGTVELRGVPPDIQRDAAEAVDELIDEMGLPPGEVRRLHSVELEGGGLGAAPGSYDYGKNELYLNPRKLSESGGLDEEVSFDSDVVPDTYRDIIRHELAHAAHFMENGIPSQEALGHLTDDEREFLAGNISEYAASNPLEAVAEIGTLLARGDKPSDGAMEIYDKYGGPDI